MGIRVVEWIKVPLNFPGDATIDSYLTKLKAAGRSKWIQEDRVYYRRIISVNVGYSVNR